MVSATDLVGKASEVLDVRATHVETMSRYYRGAQGSSFMSPKALEATGGRLRALPVNLTRVAVDVLAERLEVQGFTDPGAWTLWNTCRMVTGSAQGHLDSLLYGCGFVSVWAGPDGSPRIRVESPRQTVVTLDPVTGEPVSAVKRWHQDRRGRAVVFTRDTVTRLATSSEIPKDAGLPADGWSVLETMPNALGEVPVTPLPNRATTDAPGGESEVTDVMPLVDAISKLCQDLVVVSEAHSRPRRWASGIEVPEEPLRDTQGAVVTDDDGEPVMVAVNPFAESPERVWTSENAEARFGEFPASSLGSFVEGVGLLLRQVAAVSAVPPAVLGLSQDAPASAEALRASEVALVTRAQQRQAVLGEAWARVARHALIVRDGVERAEARDVRPVWRNAESRSEVVAADRASKLHALGVPLPAILADLGWSPTRVAEVMEMRRAEEFERLAADVAGLVR